MYIRSDVRFAELPSHVEHAIEEEFKVVEQFFEGNETL
jgi:hypothetical protein